MNTWPRTRPGWKPATDRLRWCDRKPTLDMILLLLIWGHHRHFVHHTVTPDCSDEPLKPVSCYLYSQPICMYVHIELHRIQKLFWTMWIKTIVCFAICLIDAYRFIWLQFCGDSLNQFKKTSWISTFVPSLFEATEKLWDWTCQQQNVQWSAVEGKTFRPSCRKVAW